MTIQRTNTMLRIAAALMIAGGVCAVAASLMMPINTAATISTNQIASQGANVNAARPNLPPLDQFEAIWARPLSGRRVAPSSQPAVTETSGLTLLGTVGDRIALMQNGGETEVHSLGEQIDGAELTAVRNGEVDLRTGNNVITLHKPAEATAQDFIHAVSKP